MIHNKKSIIEFIEIIISVIYGISYLKHDTNIKNTTPIIPMFKNIFSGENKE